MPNATKINLLGFELNKETPNLAEWVSKWGEASILKEATNNIVYRVVGPSVRSLFLHGREEEKDDKGVVTVTARKGVDDITGIARETKQVTLKSKNADGTNKTTDVYSESEADYFKRVLAAQVKEGKFADLDAARASWKWLADECLALVEFDASETVKAERGAKGIPKVYLEAAQSALTKGNGQKLAKFLTKACGRPVGKTENGQFTVTAEELALAMKEDAALQAAARQKELAAAIG